MQNNKKQHDKLSFKAGWLSILVNLLLFGLKYWAGLVSGSVALLADAWHTLSDSFSSVVVLVGAKVSSIPPDKEHPFGHGRANLISAIIIGVLLAVIAFSFLMESINKLIAGDSAHYGMVAIVVTIISVVIKELMARFSIWASNKTNNKALKADGWHHRSDALSSLVILGGIFLNPYFWWIDGVLGLIVAIILFYTSYEVIKEGTYPLLGEPPDPDTIQKVEIVVKKAYGREIHLHHVHIHRYGHHVEMTFHIKLPKDISLQEAHDIVTKIERAIRKKLDIETTIHPEPI